MIITSTSNSKIKQIRQIQDKKQQKKSNLFYMEGLRIIGEAYKTENLLETVIFCPELLKSEYGNQLIEQGKQKGLEILEVSESVFKSFSMKENPQGIAAIGIKKEYHLDDLNTKKGIIVALTEIADPGNLGTIIRTSDAVDANGIVLLGDSVNPYESGSVRGSMGALFSQKIVRTDFETFLAWKNEKKIKMVGTSDHTETDYLEISYPNPIILLMGSERQGLTREQIDSCDFMARIPMLRSSDSLNLAVATGIMLYQIYNCHRGYVLTSEKGNA